MKTYLIPSILLNIFFLLLSYPAFSDEEATIEECIEKIKTAAALVQEIGMAATLEKIQEESGPFMWKNTYVFGINMKEGTTIAHPLQPELIGKKIPDLKDINGKHFFMEFIKVAETKGEGWVHYLWPKPGEKTPSPKSTYVYKIPGYDILFAAGVYQNHPSVIKE